MFISDDIYILRIYKTMSKHIKITQSDLVRIVETILKEIEPSAVSGGDDMTTSKLDQLSTQEVYLLQGALKQTEFGSLLGTTGPNKDGVDGDMGEKTKIAFSKFQQKNNITGEDGILGNKTMALLKPLMDKVKMIKPKASAPGAAAAPAKGKTAPYLLFDGKSLKMVVNGITAATYNAWSGRTKWNATTAAQKALVAKMVDKIEFMKVKGAGPIPEGAYYLGPIQKRTNGDSLKFAGKKDWYELLKIYDAEYSKIGDNHNFNAGTAQDMIAWGNYRMAIIPKGGTETFGRGSFYLHGGGLAGSIGCIDLVDRIDDFVRIYQAFLSKSGLKTMDLFVDYSGKMKGGDIPVPYIAKTPDNVGYPQSDKFQDFLDASNKRFRF